jgi:predicted nucleotidyltransferase
MAVEILPDHAPTREEALPRLRTALPQILAGQPVLSAYLYGSVAEDCALPGSDVDVALVLLPDHGLSSYQRMLLELDFAKQPGRLRSFHSGRLCLPAADRRHSCMTRIAI